MTQLYSIEEILAAQKALKVMGSVPRLVELAQAVGAGQSVEIVGANLSATAKPQVATKAKLKSTKQPGKAKAQQSKESAEPKAKPEGGKRSRTSKAEVDALKAKVFEQAQKLGSEFSSGELANQLGVERSDVARMLKKLVDEGKVTMSGERKNTRYQVTA